MMTHNDDSLLFVDYGLAKPAEDPLLEVRFSPYMVSLVPRVVFVLSLVAHCMSSIRFYQHCSKQLWVHLPYPLLSKVVQQQWGCNSSSSSHEAVVAAHANHHTVII